MVIVVAGLQNQAVYLRFDPLYCLGMVVLAVSAALFGSWMRSIPALIEHHLYNRCTPTVEAHDRFGELLKEAYAQLTSRQRFIPIGIGLAVSSSFIGAMLWSNSSVPGWQATLGWSLGLLPWGWMIGTAGAVAFGISRLVRKVGAAGILQILPEHPDGCGWLCRRTCFVYARWHPSWEHRKETARSSPLRTRKRGRWLSSCVQRWGLCVSSN